MTVAINTENIFVILNSLILIVTVTLCSIVIPLILQDKKTKKVTRNFLLSLCISDLIRVVLGSGFLILVGTGLNLGDSLCIYGVTLFLMSQIANPLVTVVTTLDRYFSVGYPIQYKATMTENVSKIVIALNWTVVITIGLLIPIVFQKPYGELPEFVKTNYTTPSCLNLARSIKEEFLIFYSMGLALPSLIVIAVTNIRLYFIIKRMQMTSSKETSLYVWIKTNIVNGEGQVNDRSGRLMSRENRSTIIISLSVTNFVAVWTPIICFRIAQYFGIRYNSDVYYTIYTALQIYSVINPFLYIFTIKHYKLALAKLLARVLCCRSKVTSSKYESPSKRESISVQ